VHDVRRGGRVQGAGTWPTPHMRSMAPSISAGGMSRGRGRQNESRRAQRTGYVVAVANEGQALAFSHKIPVALLLASGLPGVSLAVHDAPCTVNVASVVTGKQSGVALCGASTTRTEGVREGVALTIRLSNTLDGAW